MYGPFNDCIWFLEEKKFSQQFLTRQVMNTPGACVPARLLGKTLASISECVDVDDCEKFSHQNASLLFSPFWIKVIPNENFLLTDYVRHGLFACVTVFIQKGLFFLTTHNHLLQWRGNYTVVDDLALVAHMTGTAALYPVNNLLKTFSENSHNSLKRLFSESDLSAIWDPTNKAPHDFGGWGRHIKWIHGVLQHRVYYLNRDLKKKLNWCLNQWMTHFTQFISQVLFVRC